MRERGKKTQVFVALITVLSVTLFALWSWQSKPGYNIEPGFRAVEKAYLKQRSGMMVEVSGPIVRILTADPDVAERQKFVVRLQNGQSVLVVHDIRESEKVPVSINDEVTVRGEYVWTEPGGIIQWTRHDSSLERRHGWIEHQGIKYD
jgi:hypothetical protein